MRVGILGPLEVAAGDRTVEIGGARLRTLLIRLALDAGRTVSVDSLAYALWPDGGPDDHPNALQSLVSRLRRILSDGTAVQWTGGGYRLAVEPDAVDALRFERLADDGRRALRAGEPESAARRLRAALALWRGEALVDVATAPFAAAEIVRLGELRLAAIEDRIAAELETLTDITQSVAELEALARTHPLRERVRTLLVIALGRAGRQAEALSSYEEYRRRVADELGADPGPELQSVHLALLRGEQMRGPARSRRRRGNLSEPLTSFVGRDQEQAQIIKQLGERRLITLVGPGGVGKTRLATAVAANVASDLPGGVWLVDLVPVTDSAEVANAVAGALGLRDLSMLDAAVTAHDATQRVAEALSSTEALLVLDNCEHVINGAAQLVDYLLARCAQLRVLATSRESLGITGETRFVVSPLELPDPDASLVDAATTAAARLFADRAAAARPGFAVTGENIRAVTEICRRLDGLPLALELAAARLRSLPVRDLAARLDDRLHLLTRGSRTAPQRHRTLRDVLAWSWEPLDEAERQLAEQLAVFPGGISLAAAEWMSATGTAIDTLAGLVDKSLIEMIDQGTPRYRMLETIREYGQERLTDRGALAQARSAHAAYFLHLAESAEPHLRGSGQLPWLDVLRTEHDNMLAAVRHACGSGDANTATRLAAALGLFWTIRGSHTEAADWLGLALSTSDHGHPEARAVATVFYVLNAVLADRRPETPATDDIVRELRGAPRGDHPVLSLVQPAIGLISGDAGAGLAMMDQRPGPSDAWSYAMWWFMRALLQANAGDLRRMSSDLAIAAEAFASAGELWGATRSHTYLAYAHITLGDFDSAITALETAIDALQRLDPADEAILPRTLLAEARAHRGDVDQSRADLRGIIAGRAGIGPAGDVAVAHVTLGDLARRDGDLGEAARQYEAALSVLVPDSVYGSLAHVGMAQLAVAQGNADAAQSHLAVALPAAVAAVDPPLVATVAVAVARLCASRGDASHAAEILGAAHALRGAAAAVNPDVARLREDLVGVLGEHAYQISYDRGRGLDRTDALARIDAQARR